MNEKKKKKFKFKQLLFLARTCQKHAAITDRVEKTFCMIYLCFSSF